MIVLIACVIKDKPTNLIKLEHALKEIQTETEMYIKANFWSELITEVLVYLHVGHGEADGYVQL